MIFTAVLLAAACGAKNASSGSGVTTNNGDPNVGLQTCSSAPVALATPEPTQLSLAVPSADANSLVITLSNGSVCPQYVSNCPAPTYANLVQVTLHLFARDANGASVLPQPGVYNVMAAQPAAAETLGATAEQTADGTQFTPLTDGNVVISSITYSQAAGAAVDANGTVSLTLTGGNTIDLSLGNATVCPQLGE